jgi:5-methyltetrahydrofolate--homocysteine methyltransferase
MQPDPFHAEIIESSARALGAHAAEILLETNPDAHAFGTPAFRGWQEHLAARLQELAGALRAGEPALFGAALAWAKLAFESRGIDPAELTGSIEALRVALREGLPLSGEDAVEPCLRAARSALTRPTEHAPPAMAGPHGELAARYLVALLGGDRRAAIALLVGAMDDALHPRDALLHVIVPAAREVGRMWHLGEVGIGEEHFCTATASLLMGAVRERLEMEEPNGRCVVIASVPGNRHELAGRIAGLLLESGGWRVVDLGTEMPARDLVEAAGDFRADLIVLGAMLTTQVETARVTLSAIRADGRTAQVPVIVGGHVFDEAPGLWRRIDADAHARTIGQVVELADALTRRLRGELNDG